MYSLEKELFQMVKQLATEGILNLPDESTWDDIMYYLYVNQKIEKGLEDIEKGNVYTREEVREYLRNKQ